MLCGMGGALLMSTLHIFGKCPSPYPTLSVALLIFFFPQKAGRQSEGGSDRGLLQQGNGH